MYLSLNIYSLFNFHLRVQYCSNFSYPRPVISILQSVHYFKGISFNWYYSEGNIVLFFSGRFPLACVAGGKRGGGRGREKSAKDSLSPIPLVFPPYPLPFSTPASQVSFPRDVMRQSITAAPSALMH